MKFGVREICDVVFKATAPVTLGTKTYAAGEPVLYIDTATTSTLTGAATTVYAQGGQGNARLLAWEGDKTLTFEVDDAMISPLGMAMLSGAGLIDASVETPVNVHTAVTVAIPASGNTALTLKGSDLDLTAAQTVVFSTDANTTIYGTVVDGAGAVVRSIGVGVIAASGLTGPAATTTVTFTTPSFTSSEKAVVLDFYVKKTTSVHELTIEAAKFAGYYYVEASTLFRDQNTGSDLPAEFIIPKAKIQSNFTFTMASTGNPSTFKFTMDAFPAPTRFDSTKQVLAAIQIIEA